MKELIFKENNKPYLITDLDFYNQAELIVKENGDGLFNVVKLPHFESDELNLNTILDMNKLQQLASNYKTIVETKEVLVKAHNY